MVTEQILLMKASMEVRLLVCEEETPGVAP